MKLAAYCEPHGRIKALATACGVSANFVSSWLPEGAEVPAHHCPSVELATGGIVSVEDLRPDVAWLRVRDKRWPHVKGRPVVDVYNWRHPLRPVSPPDMIPVKCYIKREF